MHSYDVALTRGQYLRVTASQQSSDLALRLYSPEGALVAEVNHLTNGTSTKPISAIAEQTGIYRLEISPLREDAAAGSYELSIDRLQEATPDDFRRHTAETLFAKAEQLRIERRAETLKSAINKYEEALPLFVALLDRSGEANTLLNAGMASAFLSDYPKALDYFTRSIPAFEAIGDRLSQAEALNNIASVHFFQGDSQKALEGAEKSLAIYKQLGDRRREGEVISNIGSIYMQMGEARRAIEYFDQALLIAQSEGNRRYESSILSRLGAAYDDLGEPQQGLHYYDRALALRRELNDRRGQALTLTNIGAIYRDQGEPHRALDSLNAALNILQDAGDRLSQARTLDNIGLIYAELGDLEKAEQYYRRALAISEEIEERGGQVASLNNLAVVYLSRGDLQGALASHDRALELARAMNDRRGEARTLVRIGHLHVMSNNIGEAISVYGQSLEKLRAIGDRKWEAVALTNLGKAFHLLGEHERAIGYLEQSLSISRALGERPAEADTLYRSALVKRDAGRLEQARAAIEGAIDLIESVRDKVADMDLQAVYFASKRELYELHADLLMRLHAADSSSDHDVAAFQASERARARSLLDLLIEARVNINRGADSALVERKARLQQQINAKDRHRSRLLARKHTDAQVAEVDKELSHLLIELQQVRASIRASHPGYASLTQPAPLGLPEVQRLLDEDTLLLEYLLGTEQSFLWAATQSSFSSHVLPGRAEIEAHARRMYELLARPGQTAPAGSAARDQEGIDELDEIAATLARILLGPVASQLSKKRLLIVGDGALQYIPFAALPVIRGQGSGGRGQWGTYESARIHADNSTRGPRPPTPAPRPPAPDPRPLIADHEVINLPSASVLEVLRRETAGRPFAPKTLAVLADPVFNKNDPRVIASRAAKGKATPVAYANANGRPGPGPDIAKKAHDAGFGDFNRLHFSRQEAEAIAGFVPGEHRFKALDFAASRASALGPELGRYRILHFATHALLNSRHPELTGLVFSLVDEQGQPQDGFLRLHEIYNLKLGADLVVLSACQSALGKEVRGEGLIGLTRGFMYAGAPRVVASLWRVDDRATAELMKLFYRAMLKQGLRPAAALRAAQVSLLGDKRWSAPHYWAAFTIQGEWR